MHTDAELRTLTPLLERLRRQHTGLGILPNRSLVRPNVSRKGGP